MNMRDRLQNSAIRQLLLWLVMVVAGFAVVMLVMVGVGAIKGSVVGGVGFLRMIQALQTLMLFIVPALCATWCWTQTPLTELRLRSLPTRVEAVWVVMLMVLASPAVNMLANWNSGLHLPEALQSLERWMVEQEEAAALLTEQFLQADNVGGLVRNICLMALLPALGEELTFRGVLLNICLGKEYSKKRMHLSVWATAALFSFIHFQFFGFIPRLLLGVMFGYLVIWTGSIWTSMLAHLTNNALAVITYYICAHSSLESEAVDAFGTGNTLWVGLLSAVVTAVMLWWLWRLGRRHTGN